MLAFLRRKQKGLKWVLWLVILTLGAGMLLLFVSTPGDMGGGLSARDVAQVSGQPITANEFRKQYRRLYDMYRQVYRLDQQDPELVRQLGLGQQALNQLIGEYALASEAQRLGIDASSEEVREEIIRQPVFQENGQFIGPERYRQILEQNNLTVSEFETSVSRDIIRQKLMHLLTDGILVTPEEVREEFASRNQEAKVRYVALDREAPLAGPVDEQALRNHYEQNKQSYQTGEMRQLDYVFVPADPTAVTVSEEQVQARLNSINPQEQVHARHILISAREGEDDTEARKKAESVLARLKAGEDFGQLAKAVSEDPGSAVKGGDLGFFERGQMVPEFESVAFSLPPGQTSELVKSPFGFHIINVIEKTTTKPESQKPMVEFELRQTEAEKKARDQAYRIINGVKARKALAEVAAENKLQVNSTPFFGAGDVIPGMTVRNDFNQRVFGMNRGDVSQPYQGPGGFYVAVLTEVKPPEIPSFEQLRERVERDYRTVRGEEQAREKAFAFEKAAKAGNFEQAAKAAGLKVTTTAYFKKGANVDDTVRFSQDFHTRAFRMAEGEVSPPVQAAGKYVILQLIDKSDLDEARFEAEKSQIERELTDQKRSQFFAAYAKNLVDDLKKKNEIVVNQQLLDDVTS
jgi:peptidyl-prolyl cis-trans isomerase D